MTKRLSLLAISVAALWPTHANAEPRHFIFIGGDSAAEHADLLGRDDIEGVQVVYSWRRLEREEGVYDFSAIEADLALAESLGKELFVQIQDRFFSPRARNIPRYILNEPAYGGGLVEQRDTGAEGSGGSRGWATMQWNPAVRARYQSLLSALAQEFDGRILGLNLPETSIDIDQANDDTGFSCEGYVSATLENVAHAEAAFSQSHVIQYVNFWPCEWNNDQGFMERTFAAAKETGFGLGNPDIAPNRRGQMKNAYPFFHQYKGQLTLVAMAVQEPTLTYRNPETGVPYTRDEFIGFADDYLGVDIIFWTPAAPWLSQSRN